MAVLRIVANQATDDPEAAGRFYREVFGLALVMDHGWFQTLASDASARPQLGFATEGGSGAPVPDLSIEVDDLDEVHRRALAVGAPIAYPLTEEPWGVRRFFLRDPAGRLVNVLSHL